MKTTVQLHDFINNPTLSDSFSYDGRVALFNFFEEYEDSTGETLEFDPVAIRCEFTEYTDLNNVAQNYYELNDECETEEEMLEWLQDRTQVIVFDTGVIIQDF